MTPRVLKHPVPRAAVAKWLEELRGPDDRWHLRPGPRQIGKTTSLGHVAKRLLEHVGDPRRVAIVTADDPLILEACKQSLETVIDELVKQAAPTAEEPLFLLVDEVQELPDWAKQLKSAWDKHHHIIRLIATGSSAMEILRPADADFHGRIRVVKVHAMKFREILECHPDAPTRLPRDVLEGIRARIAACREALRASHAATAAAFQELHGFIEAHGVAAWLHHQWMEYLAWGGYPATRPGSPLTPAQRVERFSGALDTVMARDVSKANIRKNREFRLLFQTIVEHAGGKFEPYRQGNRLATDGDTVRHWKHLLEDAMLVQQLPPLKPNLDADRGADKAYPMDPGWTSHAAGNTTLAPGNAGMAAECVVIDHVRRLQFNLAGTSLPIGYVSSPEVDVAAKLEHHWLLVEVKFRNQPQARFGNAGSSNDIRIVATRDTFSMQDDAPLYVPALELALVC